MPTYPAYDTNGHFVGDYQFGDMPRLFGNAWEFDGSGFRVQSRGATDDVAIQGAGRNKAVEIDARRTAEQVRAAEAHESKPVVATSHLAIGTATIVNNGQNKEPANHVSTDVVNALSAVAGFALSTRDCEAVTRELGATEGNPELRSTVQWFETLGRVVTDAALKTYLYDRKGLRDARAMNGLSAGSKSRVEEAMVRRFSLARLVVGGATVHHRGEPTGISMRLVGCVYLAKGFLHTYNMIVPVLEEATITENRNYKSIVQYYAQKERLTLRCVRPHPERDYRTAGHFLACPFAAIGGTAGTRRSTRWACCPRAARRCRAVGHTRLMVWRKCCQGRERMLLGGLYAWEGA